MSGQIDDETLRNFIFKKAPKKGREKETSGKDRSPTKQRAQTKVGHKEEREPLRKNHFLLQVLFQGTLNS
jgi:hypothetical protein